MSILLMKYVSSTDRVIFFHIGECESYPRFSISDSNLKMYTKIFLRRGQKLHIQLNRQLLTYLPIRLANLGSPLGSGMVTVLLERIDPEILKHFLAMLGSLMKWQKRV